MTLPIESFEPSMPARRPETPVSSYMDALVARRWSILAAVLATIAVAVVYLLLARPVYRADILVQVEEEQPTSPARTLLGDVSAMFDLKPATSGEMEILRSRTVVRAAVDRYLLYIDASPDYFPVVGRWLAKQDYGQTVAQWLPANGYAWTDEKIAIGKLDVPRSLLAKKLQITALGDGRYRLVDRKNDLSFEGRVGQLERFAVPDGSIDIDSLFKLDCFLKESQRLTPVFLCKAA